MIPVGTCLKFWAGCRAGRSKFTTVLQGNEGCVPAAGRETGQSQGEPDSHESITENTLLSPAQTELPFAPASHCVPAAQLQPGWYILDPSIIPIHSLHFLRESPQT